MNFLGIFSRLPREGDCKTRIAAELGPRKASALAEAFVTDLAGRLQSAADRRFLCYTPASSEAAVFFRRLAADRFKLWPQPAGTLDERMLAFITFAASQGATKAVILGADAPTLPAEYIEMSFDLLSHSDVVIGPAFDGGFYLIGMQTAGRVPDRGSSWLAGVDWGQPTVLHQAVQRVRASGLSLGLLPPWYDVDTADDVRMLRGHLDAMLAAGADPQAPRTQGELARRSDANER